MSDVCRRLRLWIRRGIWSVLIFRFFKVEAGHLRKFDIIWVDHRLLNRLVKLCRWRSIWTFVISLCAHRLGLLLGHSDLYGGWLRVLAVVTIDHSCKEISCVAQILLRSWPWLESRLRQAVCLVIVRSKSGMGSEISCGWGRWHQDSLALILAIVVGIW